VEKIKGEAMTSIVDAKSDKDFKKIEELATIIWTEHYTPIIGTEQVNYMLEHFQSVKTMKKQVTEGANYYLINFQNTAIGYLSAYKKEDSLFLSKIYILKTYRGKSIGKTAMNFIQQKAETTNCKSISLTVNKNNTGSIEAYKKLGFQKTKELITDIGNGYVMDDYEMKKSLS